MALGGDIYFGPVEEVLASGEGEPDKAVLDLGYACFLAAQNILTYTDISCGTGDW